MRGTNSTSGPLLFALAASSALGATGACVLPGYDVTSSSGGDAGGDTTTSTGGAGGATTTPTDTTGGNGGTGATTSTGTTGGGGAGGAGGAGGTTTSSTSSSTTVCVECPQWAIGFGSSEVDVPHAVAVDPVGAIAVVGEIHGAASLTQQITLTWKGLADGFLVRATGSGTVVAGKSFAGDASGGNNQVVRDVIYTASGVIVAGEFVGTLQLDGVTTLVNAAGGAGLGTDGFVARYNLDGTLAWHLQLGGSNNDTVRRIALDPAGNVVVAGMYTGNSTIAGVPLDSFAGGTNGFVLKVDGAGMLLAPSVFPVRSWGSPDDDLVTGLAVGPQGEVFVAGHHTKTLGFDDGSVATLANPSTTTPDGYLIRLGPAGEYTLAKPLGGAGSQRVFGLVTDGAGAVFVAGIFDGTLALGSAMLTDAGAGPDIFVARLDASGTAIWAAQGVDAGSAPPLALALSKEGGPVVAGGFTGTTALFGPTAVTAAGTDAFVVLLDAGGNVVKRHVYSHPDDQRASAVAVDGSSGAIVVAGENTGTVDFGVGIPVVSSGGSDILLFRIEP